MIGDADLNIYKELTLIQDLHLKFGMWPEAWVMKNISSMKQNTRFLDDHIPFIEAGIPAVDIIDIEYAYWHTTQDTVDKVSPRSLGVVGDTLLQWILLQKNNGSMGGK